MKAGSRVGPEGKYAVVIGLCLLAPANIARGDAFSFEDIQYWIGTGDNRAALVIDWVENAVDPPALVWGYRWDGAATGADMLRDVLVADDRLFAKLGSSMSSLVATYGIGYDANDDGIFALNDGTAFNADGIVVTDAADLAIANDPDDLYAEGWYTGFWHYGIASSNPYDGGAWADTPQGMATRNLTDGAWDSWTFSPTFNFASFAMNPLAAQSPFSSGDYDLDGVVSVADYARWKARYGSTDAAADGNGNGIVDAADYTVWRNNLGMGVSAASQPAAEVPEPHLAIVGLLTLLVIRRRTIREHSSLLSSANLFLSASISDD
jgi:hypothetical protein